MLDLDQLVPLFDRHFTRSAFRLEVLRFYSVASDGGEYQRYIDGRDPEPGFKEQWTRVLSQERAAGKRRHRVHVLETPLNDYLRYECEWGYAPNVAAGEEVKILDLTEMPVRGDLVDDEFWLLDDEVVFLMRYDDAGEFVGAEQADDVDRYRQARDLAEASAEDFETWWARHPEEHRDHWMSTVNR
ncbi:MAG: hypothetical protein J2P24_00200 [Streptosporangiales bacterium]|nr:hypothetical protein [Streptosporangiales bacterium]